MDKEQAVETPFFSIILLVPKDFHLISFSLESILAQKEKDYEIIIIEHGLLEQHLETLKQTSEKIIRILPSFVSVRVRMMNRALPFARGKYVQFMQAGDILLSPNSLKEIKQEIERSEHADVIITNYLVREDGKNPEAHSRRLSKEMLKKGHMPSRLEGIWFSRKIFPKMPTFDKRYELRECYDLFCRLMQTNKVKAVHLNKVFTDFMPIKRSARQVVSYELETFLIIYRNFGFWSSCLWTFFEDHFHLFKMWLEGIKQAFFKNR